MHVHKAALMLLAATLTTVAYGEPCRTEICEEAPPPPACEEVNQNFSQAGCPPDFGTSDMDFCFSDSAPTGSGYPSQSPSDDQIYVLGNNPSGSQDCGIILAKETGYYAIYDSELSESCADQKDETGYLTVHNSCNEDGWATTRNVGDRLLVLDRDNQGAGCTGDSACATGYVCREGTNHGNCCVPEEPVYVGTFLLVAGEENVICIRHWCPEWRELSSQDPSAYEQVFVHDQSDPSKNCTSPDSIHFKIAATAVACRQEGYVQACAGGCENGDCLPHPCFTAACPKNCRLNASGDAECVDENPCANVACEYGCVFGLCLQGPDAHGEDGDGDGYVDVADCDDSHDKVSPAQVEDCDNGIDDDCDGFIDCDGGGSIESPGEQPVASGDGSTAGGSGDDAGCGCRVVGKRVAAPTAIFVAGLAALAAIGRRRRQAPGA